MPHSIRTTLAPLALVVAAGACSPKAIDMRPFAEQTDALAEAVAESGQATVSLMLKAEELDDSVRSERNIPLDADPSPADLLAEHWLETQGTLAALAAYADSLAALREAVDESDVAVSDAVNSLNSLLDVVGVGRLSAALTNAAAKAYEAITERNAGKAQLKAMTHVQSQVEDIGDAVVAQLEQLEILAYSAASFAEQSVNARTGSWRTYYENLDDELELVTARLERYQEIELVRERATRLAALRAYPMLAATYAPLDPYVQRQIDKKKKSGHCSDTPSCIDDTLLATAIDYWERVAQRSAEELAQLTFGGRSDAAGAFVDQLPAAHAQWMDRVTFIRSERAHYAADYADYLDEIDAIRDAADTTAALASAASAGVRAWVETHGDLKRALEEGSGVTIVDLVVAVTQIRFIYEDFRKAQP